jgi:hypothetical protein
MFEAFAKQVRLDEVRGTQRSAKDINTVVVIPLFGAKHVGRVGEDAAIIVENNRV